MQRTLCAAFLAVLASVPAPQELNRLQLDNGGDTLWFINAPYVGAPVDDFDPLGDLYWKAFPSQALRRNDGSSELWGLELVVADPDFDLSETLWAYSVSVGTQGTDQSILPVFPPAVFVPGLSTTGTIFGGECAAPGYVTMFVYDEVFLDTLGNPTPLIDLTADGSVDWVFTHYFPGPGPFCPQNLVSGLNTCGTVGDATMQWFGSTDGIGAVGENQPDWTGAGISTYSGFTIGGGASFEPIPEDLDDVPQLAFYFDEPTLTPWVDVDDGEGPGGEQGLAALRFPLNEPPAQPRIGFRLYDQEPGVGAKAALAAANLRPSLLSEFGIVLPFLGTTMALNPTDPIFVASTTAWGQGALEPTDGELAFTSNLFVVPVLNPALVDGTTLEVQGFSLDLGTGTAEASNLFEMTLHTP